MDERVRLLYWPKQWHHPDKRYRCLYMAGLTTYHAQNHLQQMQAMTPERSGPTVVVAQPQAPQMQAPMGGGGGGQSMPNVSSGEIELNRLMTQRLLLELAYT